MCDREGGRNVRQLGVLVGLLLCACPSSDSPKTDGRLALGDGSPDGDATAARLLEKVLVDKVAPVRIPFDLLTYKDRQFVAYFDKDHMVKVAARTLGATTWTFKQLPSKMRFDIHNHLTMAVDGNEDLHVCGNMHNEPLDYYRTTDRLDVLSLVKIEKMVGTEESSVTYPKFLRDPKGRLIFKYRSGSSGNGDTYYNLYDAQTKTWSRLLDKPLLSTTAMSAYDYGPVADSGYFHYVWFWRNADQSDHDLCYARSPDLLSWSKSDGTPLALPVTFQTSEIVDPVPATGGLITFNIGVGFDTQHRPVVAYHKYNASGDSQLYNARLEGGAWRIYQTSNWKGRWTAETQNTNALWTYPVEVEADGRLTQGYYHWTTGWGKWWLDEKTLKPRGTLTHPKTEIPEEVTVPPSGSAEMMVPCLFGRGDEPWHRRYFICWEAMKEAADGTPPAIWPPPGEMFLYRLPDSA